MATSVGSSSSWKIVLLLIMTLLGYATPLPEEFVDDLVMTAPRVNSASFTVNRLGEPILFITEKIGKVWVSRNAHKGDEDTVREVALDVSEGVCDNSERGLQSVLPHPNYAENGLVYIFRTVSVDSGCGAAQNLVSRFYTDQNTDIVMRETEVEMLRTPVETGTNHHGGAMKFGKDGLLYLTTGDGGRRQSTAQDMKNLHGSILRLTEYGEVPDSNPFVGTVGVRCNETGQVPLGLPSSTVCSEIFAYGFRNPFRIALDPTSETTRFIVSDVGSNAWEELSECGIDCAGKNFGWPVREGPCQRGGIIDVERCSPHVPDEGVDSFVDPFHWWGHVSGGAAASAGAFVPPGVWPIEYDNLFVYSDFIFEEIYLLAPENETLSCRAPLCGSGYPVSAFLNETFHTLETGRLVDMFFGPYEAENSTASQALYYIYWNGGGGIRRIRYTGFVNQKPVAVLYVSRTNVTHPGLGVVFYAIFSYDPEDLPLIYEWDFGDGTTSNRSFLIHTFDAEGTYLVKLTVEDAAGFKDEAFVTITVGIPPTIDLLLPAEDDVFKVGEQIWLFANVFNRDGELVNDEATYTWTVDRHHADHTHPWLTDGQGNGLVTHGPPPEDFLAATNSFLRVYLEACHESLCTTVSRDVMPDTVLVNFSSVPEGQIIHLDGEPVVLPATIMSWVDHSLLVEVPFQTGGYGFDSWSDGRARSHQYAVRTINPPRTVYFVRESYTQYPNTILLESGDEILDGYPVSANDFQLSVEADGKLILSVESTGMVLWESSFEGIEGDSYYARLQGDCNWVVRRGIPGISPAPSVWRSDTSFGDGNCFIGVIPVDGIFGLFAGTSMESRTSLGWERTLDPTLYDDNLELDEGRPPIEEDDDDPLTNPTHPSTSPTRTLSPTTNVVTTTIPMPSRMPTFVPSTSPIIEASTEPSVTTAIHPSTLPSDSPTITEQQQDEPLIPDLIVMLERATTIQGPISILGYVLELEADGSLTLKHENNNVVLWQSDRAAAADADTVMYARLQGDCNLVVHFGSFPSAKGLLIWNSASNYPAIDDDSAAVTNCYFAVQPSSQELLIYVGSMNTVDTILWSEPFIA